MLKKVISILGIVLTILQIFNLSTDILKKLSNRASNTVVYIFIINWFINPLNESRCYYILKQ